MSSYAPQLPISSENPALAQTTGAAVPSSTMVRLKDGRPRSHASHIGVMAPAGHKEVGRSPLQKTGEMAVMSGRWVPLRGRC